ncbi:MAG: hypothetical protein MK142_10235, partial [Pseudomonadales bacterium]|nr:hypothetical protein [Pseudomonadales bacterium]
MSTGRTRRFGALLLSFLLTSVALGAPRDASAEAFAPALYDAIEYRLVGPYRGGRSATVTGVPGDRSTYYFGSVGGGVWKTTDGGAKWRNVSDGFFGGSVGAVAVSESDPNVLYVGLGEKTIRGNVSSNFGVWKSTDAGKNWRFIGLEDTRHIGRIRVHPTNPDIVYVAAMGDLWQSSDARGVYKSTDGGETWRRVLFANQDAGAVDLVLQPGNARILYASTWNVRRTPHSLSSGGPGSDLWKSTDAGETWEKLTDLPGLPAAPRGIIGVTVSPANPERVWAIIEAEDGGVFRSDDAGESWKKLNSDRALRSRAWYYTRIIADSQNENRVYVMNVSYGVSEDGGKTFSLHRAPHGDHHDLWIDPEDNTRMIIADDGGAQVSTDAGASWTTYHNQPTAQFYRIATDDHFPYRIYGAQQDNSSIRIAHRGSNGAAITERDWEVTAGGESAYHAVDPTNPDVLYAMATQNMKSVDGGMTWSRLRPPHGDSHDMWINPDDPQHFVQANDGGANVTFNGGETWSTQFNQPTAELYQVEVDDQYPYWLYAGQQDNGTTIAVPSMPPFRAQDEQAWLVDAGGCETGPAVPKPGNANIVYANCKGRFSVFDKRLGTERSHYIGAANIYGHNPADLRYRFQRVAPIHVSPHDPGVVYMGSQYVHRTRDDGRTWETISPDLTAFDPEVQVISGSPITRDITGEEYYSTLYSLRESPIEAGLIWVGANDGPVHVSRDDGATWTDVTPSRLPAGGRVDAIEPSPHDPAKAYIAVLRYQLGDWRPHIYRTTDYGRRWTQITDGIPEDEPVRVVREDPVREGLLFAGTDASVYVSFDDGASWRSLRQNLPITPVTDLKIVRGDLALSTMGRGFWVLDNIATLRQAPLPDLGEEAVLFAPAETVRYRQIYRGVDPAHGVPDYPSPAVEIDYYLPEAVDDLRLEIVAADGRVVNAYRSGDPAGESELPEVDMATGAVSFLPRASLEAGAGLHRFRWNMRHQGPWHESASRRFEGGPYAVPGEYRVRLSFDGKVLEQPLTLVPDPRVAQGGVTLADVQAQSGL